MTKILNDQNYIDEWNILHKKYAKEEMVDCHKGEEDGFYTSWPREEMEGHRNNKMADYCEELLFKANKAYRSGQPIMSDRYYDSIEGVLKDLRPDSKILIKVG